MAGWSSLKTIRKFESDVFDLGLEIVPVHYNEKWNHTEGDDHLIGLIPRDDQLPVFSRSAMVFQGSIEEAIIWMRGIAWAREYDELIKVSSVASRNKAEQKTRNRQLMESIESGKKVEGKVTNGWDSPIMKEDEDVPF